MDWTIIGVVVGAVVLYFCWEVYNGVWLDTRSNKMRAVILDAGKNIRSVRVNLNADGKSFNMSAGNKRKFKYHVTEECVYRLGTWRVPTSYYNIGQATPINIRDVKADNPQSAEEFHTATESNIARQIIETFDSSFITITSSMMIMIIVIAVANGFVFFQLNTQLEEIREALGIVPSE